MIVKVDYKEIQELFKKNYPGCNYTETKAAEAFHILADCIEHLMGVSKPLEQEEK
jgi:hypothetical protein